MNLQTPTAKRPVLCYNCDHEYSYVGTDPHPSQCPRCGEQAVSPAGTLEPISSRVVLVNGRPQVKVVATDATNRLFRYRFSVTGGYAACVEISIESIYSLKRDEWPDELLPPSIWRTAEEYGYPRLSKTVDSE